MAINYATDKATAKARGQVSELESKLLRVYRASRLLLTSLEKVGSDTYRVQPGDVLMLRHAVDAASDIVAMEAGR